MSSDLLNDAISLRRKDAAASLGISEDTLSRWKAKGWIRPAKMGKIELYPVDELKAFLKRHQNGEHLNQQEEA